MQKSLTIKVVIDEPTPSRTFVGLRNGNNWCYANVVIQLLYSFQDFASLVLTTDFQADKPFVTAIKQVFVELSHGNECDVEKIVTLMGWKDGGHHDAAEFFYYLNEKLDYESELLFEFLVSSFQVITEKGISRSLTLSTTIYNSLEKALENEAHSILLPKRVFINLDRVEEKGSQRSSGIFSFPLKLEATKIMTGASGFYSLHAIITHGGNALHGHYKILIKDEQMWREISDLNFEVIKEESIVKFYGGDFFVASSLIYEKID